MGASILRFSLDVHKTQSQVTVSASQYSTDKRLMIRLMERGIPYEIEDGCFAVFSAIKPDGKPLYNDCMIRNNSIIYDFTKQTTPVVGILPCQIHLYGADGRLLMAPRFQIIVHEAVYDGEAVESSAEYLAMSEYINHIFESYEWRGEKVFIRYSANANGADFTEFWTYGQNFIGFATGLEAPESPLAYKWVLFTGGGGSGGTGEPGKDGEDGLTPYIGENGNWWIGDEDTGVKAAGEDGAYVVAVDENGGDATKTTYTMRFSDGSTYDFDVYHGASAYDIWLAEGHTGTEADFLEWLKGADGATGATGATGADGEDGVGIASIEQTTTSTEDGGENILTITSTEGQKATFTVKNGSKGSKGEKGDTGEQGAKGDPGTSVTVSSVSESSASGGSNVVTFSDGKTLTVKNGKDGEKGDPYTLTETDKTEIAHEVVEMVPEEVYIGDGEMPEGAVLQVVVEDDEYKQIQLTPLYAESLEWLEANGEKDKLYVLPDGFIYGYFESESTQLYVNRLPEADTDKLIGSDVTTATKHTGYFSGVRLNSSGYLETQAGSYVTGFIPYTYQGEDDKIRVKNTGWCSSSKTMGIWGYDSNYNLVGIIVGYGKSTNTSFEDFVTGSGNGVSGKYWTKEVDGQYMGTFVPSESNEVASGTIDLSNVAYIRIFMGDFANAIITVNQEIIEGGTEGGLGWNNTGHAFVPANYEPRIIALEQRLDAIAPVGGDIDLDYIRNWDMPIYDANIPVFETTENKAAISNSERNCASLYAKYDALMAQYPEYITKTDHGVCSDGVTHIYQYDFKTPATYHTGSLFSEVKPKAILMSGIHREYTCAYGLYYALEEIVSNPELKHFLNNVHLIVFPCANPYAFNYDNGTHYQNANGIEIHRNFEVGFVNYEAEGDDQYSGPSPLSEIESQIIDKVMKANKDAAFVMSAHTYNNAKDGTTDHRVMWCSAGTLYTCNLACRLIQKMSVSFRKRFGDQFTGDNPNEPMGYVSVSGTGGSEYRQGTKYGIQGFNLEVSETFSPTDSTQRTSFAMSRYTEVYANVLLTAFGVYDYKDKDKYCKYLRG